MSPRIFVPALIFGFGVLLEGQQLPIVAPRAIPDNYTFRTLAGTSGAGDADGAGANARFQFPQGPALAADGSLYVGDTMNHTIRKISPGGNVTTFAGKAGESGGADGVGAAARFFEPESPAIDRNGVLYVPSGDTIRRIAPDGTVTTLAGKFGESGTADGPGSSARFNDPWGAAVDGSGNVYVADSGNHTIRKISSGVVTTLAGLAGSSGSADGAGSGARFKTPAYVTVDSAGTLFVADGDNHTIRKIVGNVVTTIAGTAGASGSTDGNGSAARFNRPSAVALFQSGEMLVVDDRNGLVRKISRNGDVTRYAGQVWAVGSTDGQALFAKFGFVHGGIAIDAADNAYLTDGMNQTVRKISAQGTVSTIAGLSSTGAVDGRGEAARFANPYGLALDRSGNAYVTDYYNHAIRKITPDGVVTTLAGTMGVAGSIDGSGPAASFFYPRHLAVANDGTIYVADGNSHTIRRITPSGDVTTLAGSPRAYGNQDGNGGAARFYYPNGIAVDSAGTVYVADWYNHTIRRITPAGDVTTLAGRAGSAGSVDGPGTTARFNYPYGLAVAADRTLYVTEGATHTIRRISPSGVVTTVAGHAGSSGFIDGTGDAARFNVPTGVAIDVNGDLIVTDNSNSAIRRVTPSGVVTTIAGGPRPGSEDGVASVAKFYYPIGVAVSPSGSIYLADNSSNTVRVGTPR